nr:MAG TPA: hypothetical protein [Crassvirales sp.]
MSLPPFLFFFQNIHPFIFIYICLFHSFFFILEPSSTPRPPTL